MLEENSSGYLFFGAGPFSKLSSEFQREIFAKRGTEYPSLNQIYEKYFEKGQVMTFGPVPGCLAF